MKSDIDCIPCYFKQVLSSVKRVTDSKELQLSAFREAMDAGSRLSLDTNPAENTYYVVKAAYEALRCGDPFKEEKKKYNKIAMEMYSELFDIVQHSDNPLHTSLKIAVAGNIIDLGILESFNISETLNKVLKDGFAIDNFDQFRKILNNTHLLYLLDNAGEIVFDKILIECLTEYCDVTVVANEGPILNDATLDDALMIGLDKVAKVITTGTDTVGKVLNKSSTQFQQLFHSADLIIAKGQANYEILSETTSNIFFLLQAKCEIVAKSLGVRLKDSVFLQNQNYVLRKRDGKTKIK